MKKISKLKSVLLAAVIFSCFGITNINRVFAASTMSVSPMSEAIILTPGERYDGYFLF